MSAQPKENEMTNEPKIITREDAIAYARRRHFDEGADQRTIMHELQQLGYVTRRGVPPTQGAVWNMLFPERAEELRKKYERKKKRIAAGHAGAKARWGKKPETPKVKTPKATVTPLPTKTSGADPRAALLAVRAVLEHPDLDSDTKVEIALQLMKKL